MSLDMKTLNSSHSRRFGVFIVNFEHISHLGLVFLLLNWIASPAVNIFSLYATTFYVFYKTGNYTVTSDNNTTVLTMKVILPFIFFPKHYQPNHKQDWISLTPLSLPYPPSVNEQAEVRI